MNIFVDYSNLDSVLNHFCQKLFYTETKLTEELIHCEDYVLDNLLKSTDQYLNKYSKVHKWIPIKRTSYQDTIMLVNKIKIAAINAYVIRKANSPYHAKSKLAMLATIENLFDASVTELEKSIPSIAEEIYIWDRFDKINLFIEGSPHLRFKRNYIKFLNKLENYSVTDKRQICNFISSVFKPDDNRTFERRYVVYMREMVKAIKELENDHSDEGAELRQFSAKYFFTDLKSPQTITWLSNSEKILSVLKYAKQDLQTNLDPSVKIQLQRIIDRYTEKYFNFIKGNKVKFPHFHHFIRDDTLDLYARLSLCNERIKLIKEDILNTYGPVFDAFGHNDETKNHFIQLVQEENFGQEGLALCEIGYYLPVASGFIFEFNSNTIDIKSCEKISQSSRLVNLIHKLHTEASTLKTELLKYISEEEVKLNSILNDRKIKDLSRSTNAFQGAFVAHELGTEYGNHGFAFPPSSIFKKPYANITSYNTDPSRGSVKVWYGVKNEIPLFKVDPNTNKAKFKGVYYVAKDPWNTTDTTAQGYENYLDGVRKDIIKRSGLNVINLPVVSKSEFFLELKYLFKASGMLVPRHWKHDAHS